MESTTLVATTATDMQLERLNLYYKKASGKAFFFIVPFYCATIRVQLRVLCIPIRLPIYSRFPQRFRRPSQPVLFFARAALVAAVLPCPASPTTAYLWMFRGSTVKFVVLPCFRCLVAGSKYVPRSTVVGLERGTMNFMRSGPFARFSCPITSSLVRAPFIPLPVGQMARVGF